MKYIVFDMEWNQPMSKTWRGDHGVLLSGEVIQIGAVKLDEKGRFEGSFSQNVAPRFYRRLHYRIRKITGLRERDLLGAPGFPEAFEAFRRFWGKDACLLTWGPDDIHILRDNLIAYGVRGKKGAAASEELPPSFDLQRVFGAQIAGESRQFALETAMEKFGLEQTLVLHDALADAMNTASIAARLDLKKGVKEEIERIEKEKRYNLEWRHFTTVRAALAAALKDQPACPECGKALGREKIQIPRATRAYLATCPKHGEFLYRVKVSREKEEYTARLKITPADGEKLRREAKERARLAKEKALAASKERAMAAKAE